MQVNNYDVCKLTLLLKRQLSPGIYGSTPRPNGRRREAKRVHAWSEHKRALLQVDGHSSGAARRISPLYGCAILNTADLVGRRGFSD